MKFNNLLFAFIILLFPILISCSNNQKKQTSENVNQVDSKPDQAGAILVQKCQSDASISFSYYLPSSFKEGKKYPVLILFDPHGDSRFAIEKYKSAADKFEFILLIY